MRPVIARAGPAAECDHGDFGPDLAGPTTVEPGQEPSTGSTAVDLPQRDRRVGWLLRLAAGALVFVGMCALSAPLVVYQVHRYPAISPIDEVTYFDYLAKVHQHHLLVREGETDGAFADHEAQCRGIARKATDSTGFAVAPNPAACRGAPHRALGYRDTADIDPPTYYIATDVGARVLLGLGVTHDLATAGRLVGIVWAGLGLSLLFLLSRLMGARRAPALLICVAALMTSGLWTDWTHVTPHASDIAVGAGVAITVVLWYRRRAPAWTLPAAGLVPVLFKASDVTVVAAAILFALVAALLTRLDPRPDAAAAAGREIRRLLTGAALLLVGLAAGSAGWLLVRQHYALTTVPSWAQFNVTSFHASYLLRQVGAFLTPQQADVGSVLTFWAFGSVVRFASDGESDLERRALSVAVIPILVFGAWLFVLSNYVLLKQYVGIPNRYGLTVLPVVLALGAANLRSRWAQAAGVLIVGLLTAQAFHPGL